MTQQPDAPQQPGSPESFPPVQAPDSADAHSYTQPTVPLGADSVPAGYVTQAPVASAPVAAQPTTLAYTNTFALVSIITTFFAPIAGIVFGHLALGQIKRNGDTGRGLALTGLIIGYAYFAFLALFFIFYIGLIVVMFASMGAAFSEFGNYYDYDYS